MQLVTSVVLAIAVRLLLVDHSGARGGTNLLGSPASLLERGTSLRRSNSPSTTRPIRTDTDDLTQYG